MDHSAKSVELIIGLVIYNIPYGNNDGFIKWNNSVTEKIYFRSVST